MEPSDCFSRHRECLVGSFYLPNEVISPIGYKETSINKYMIIFIGKKDLVFKDAFPENILLPEYKGLAYIVNHRLTSSAGSFDQLSRMEIEIMMAIMDGVKVNLGRVLFG